MMPPYKDFISKKLKPCPICKDDEVCLQLWDDGWEVFCACCGIKIGLWKTKKKAIKVWNEKIHYIGLKREDDGE